MAQIAQVHIPNGVQFEGLWGSVSLWDEVNSHTDFVMITHAKAIEILSSVETWCYVKSLVMHPVSILTLIMGGLFPGLFLMNVVFGVTLVTGILNVGCCFAIIIIFIMTLEGDLFRISQGYAEVAREARAVREGLDPALRQQAVFVRGELV